MKFLFDFDIKTRKLQQQPNKQMGVLLLKNVLNIFLPIQGEFYTVEKSSGNNL